MNYRPAPTVTVRESPPETTQPSGVIRAIRKVPNCHRSGRFPSGLTFLCGFTYVSSRTWLAAPPAVGIPASPRDWVRLPGNDRSHRTLIFGSQQVATGFWVRSRPISASARPTDHSSPATRNSPLPSASLATGHSPLPCPRPLESVAKANAFRCPAW